MYVPKMTEAEVLQEYFRDEKWILKTHVTSSHPKNVALFARMRKEKRNKAIVVSRETTKQGNRVILVKKVQLNPYDLVLYHIAIIPCDDDTIMYAMVLGGSKVVFFTPHFFDRYKERMEKNGVHIKDAILTYFKRNMYVTTANGAHQKYKNSVQFAVDDGVMLGNYRDKVEYEGVTWYLLDIRTFIPNGELSRRLEFVDNELRKGLHDET